MKSDEAIKRETLEQRHELYRHFAEETPRIWSLHEADAVGDATDPVECEFFVISMDRPFFTIDLMQEPGSDEIEVLISNEAESINASYKLNWCGEVQKSLFNIEKWQPPGFKSLPLQEKMKIGEAALLAALKEQDGREELEINGLSALEVGLVIKLMSDEIMSEDELDQARHLIFEGN